MHQYTLAIEVQLLKLYNIIAALNNLYAILYVVTSSGAERRLRLVYSYSEIIQLIVYLLLKFIAQSPKVFNKGQIN